MATAGECLPLIHRARLRKPRLSETIVPRPRLTTQLDTSLRVPLTLVAAPAGFGKTTLLAEWSVTSSAEAAWLTVDHDDRVLLHFVSHVVAAIEGIGLRANGVLDALRRARHMPAFELGTTLADALLDISHDAFLVIDNFHKAASADVESFLAGLLHDMPPRFHLVLAMRSDPAMPLARMRLLGELNEIRAGDLLFTEEETRDLLMATGHAGSDAKLATTLQQATNGWVAVLRLATMCLPAGADQDGIAEAIASQQQVADFLVEEVLAKHPATTQDFLLRTAIVDRISAPLADALVSPPPPQGSRALLEALAREHLLLGADSDDGGWYRYHPVFRCHLLHQLGMRSSGNGNALAELHAQASSWFASHGLIDEAIAHEMVVGNTENAARLVAHHVHPALNREDWVSLAAWLRQLPEAVICENPTLLLAKAWVAQISGRLAASRAIESSLAALLSEATSSVDPSTLLAKGHALVLGQLLTINHDPAAAAATALELIDRLPAEFRFARGFAYLTYGSALQSAGQTEQAVRWLTDVAEREAEQIDAGSIRAVLGLVIVHRQAGNYAACAETAQHLLGLAERHDLPVSAGWAHLALGWLAYERDDLATALEHFLGISVGHHRMYMSCVCDGFLGLALVYEVRGLPDEADATMQRLREIILDASALEYLLTIRAFEVRLALMRQEQERAISWLHAQDIVTVTSNTLLMFEHPLMTRIQVQLEEGSTGSLAQAGDDCAKLRAVAEANHHRARLVEILALEALILEAQGQRHAALEALQQSVVLAEPAEFCRTYVDLGPGIVPLLTELRARHAAQPYLDRLIAAMRPGTKRNALPDISVLTLRESDVLRALSRRLTYREIAQELHISTHTVKTHVTSIYKKLGVANRRQAHAKAVQLGWVSST